jgi:hypothetical protein
LLRLTPQAHLREDSRDDRRIIARFVPSIIVPKEAVRETDPGVRWGRIRPVGCLFVRGGMVRWTVELQVG